jgi:protein-disulfide isomerase/uncharacterized membrane protein
MDHSMIEAREEHASSHAGCEEHTVSSRGEGQVDAKRPYFSGRGPFLFLLGLALVGTFAAGFLTYRHLVLTGHSLYVGQSFLCRTEGRINCDAILLTDYATLFRLVSSAALGLMGFVFVLWCTINGILNERIRKVAWVLLVLYFFAAIGFSWYFLYIMMFQVDVVCPWCIVVHVVNIISLIFVILLSIKKRKEILIPEIASLGERVYFVAGGVLVSVLSLATTMTYEKVLVFQDLKVQYEEIANDPAVISAILRSAPQLEIPLGPEDPVYGSPSSPYAIVFFSDFRCPGCAKAEESLRGVVDANPTMLRLVFKNYPLARECNPNLIAAKGDLHPMACEAARAAYAAFILGGNTGFWKYADLLFKHQKRLAGNEWTEFARELKLDTKKFEELMGAGSPAARKVAEDVKVGIELKISSTPNLFFEGRRIPEQYRGQFLVDALEELIRAGHPEQGNVTLKRR